jgi:hypothetical protein
VVHHGRDDEDILLTVADDDSGTPNDEPGSGPVGAPALDRLFTVHTAYPVLRRPWMPAIPETADRDQ